MYPEYHKDLELLEIEEGAPLSELKTAYRELTKVWHPDRFQHDPKLAEKANRKLAESYFTVLPINVPTMVFGLLPEND